jgi:hypothetical protein
MPTLCTGEPGTVVFGVDAPVAVAHVDWPAPGGDPFLTVTQSGTGTPRVRLELSTDGGNTFYEYRDLYRMRDDLQIEKVERVTVAGRYKGWSHMMPGRARVVIEGAPASITDLTIVLRSA